MTLDQCPDMSRLTSRFDALPEFRQHFSLPLEWTGRFDYDAHASDVPDRRRVPLVQAAAVQPEFEFHDVSGTLVGFWTPEYAKTLNVPGYHLHFVSTDRKRRRSSTYMPQGKPATSDPARGRLSHRAAGNSRIFKGRPAPGSDGGSRQSRRRKNEPAMTMPEPANRRRITGEESRGARSRVCFWHPLSAKIDEGIRHASGTRRSRRSYAGTNKTRHSSPAVSGA